MKCKCKNLRDVFYIDQGPKNFKENLNQIKMENWMRLYQCPDCNQLWAIDEWEKYMPQVVSRVRDINTWASDERIKERKELLLSERGGTTDEECIWAECHEKRVVGVAYCLEHLWKTGIRR